MAFNINAQVILSGPKNIQKVRSSISKQLSGVSVDINLKVPKNAAADLGKLNSSLNTLNATLSSLNKNATSAKTALDSLATSGKNLGNFSKNLSSQNQKATKSLDSVGSSAAKAGSQLEEFGKDAALAVRRFSAFTIATGAVFGLVRAVSNATSESIKFERELARVVQVTGATDKQLKGLTRTIDGLSTSLGLDANKLLEVSVTFAQTGQSIDQVAKSLKAVSRASLAATFGDIQKTTEGVVAALAQFNLSAGRAESVLGSLNAVSKSFAVEADDLISVIRRAGGVFAASSVQLGAPEERLRELIGIFTAVRSTTRESADTIATGLRTIFTRIQRPQTIKFLEQFGVQLRATAADAKKFGLAEGDFVGIFESLKRISSEIGGLDTLQLAKVVEELGGVRQVGKLLPALREFEKAERARGVALAGTASISKDVAIATKTLAVQIENLQQRFGKLIRDVSQSDTFQNIAKFAVSAANAVLTLTDALRPALPLLTAFAGIKLAGAAFDFSKGFVGGLKKGGGSESVGANIGNLATGGGQAGKQNTAAKQASDKLVIAALNKNTQATDKNTQALTSMSTGLTTLNTTQSTLVTSANALSTQSTQLIAALNKLPAILLRGGGGSRPLPIRRRGGGSIPKFAKGGFVDGPSHAQGGVIAELEGGEFVVPKKDAKRQGLQRGGIAPPPLPSRRKTKVSDKDKKDNTPINKGTAGVNKALTTALSENTFNDARKAGVFALTGKAKKSTVGDSAGKTIPDFSKGKKFGEKLFDGVTTLTEKQKDKLNIKKIAGVFSVLKLQSKKEIGKDSDVLKIFDEASKAAIAAGVKEIYQSDTIEKVAGDLGPLTLKDKQNFKIEDLFDGATETLDGFLLEGLVGAYADFKVGGGQANLDFPNITEEQKQKLQNLFGDGALDIDVGDAKRSTDKAPDLLKKLANSYIDGKNNIGFSRFATTQFAAAGGRIGFQNGGMVPVAISNGEGLVDAATASRIMPLLDRARAGDGSAIQELAKERGIIQDIVGPGSGTSDSIKTNLAAGSFVLQKSIMDRIDGQRQKAATGGVVRGKLFGGGAAGAAGAIGLATQVASGNFDISALVFNLAFLSGGIGDLGKQFKKLKGQATNFTTSLSKDARIAKKARIDNKSFSTSQKIKGRRRTRIGTKLAPNFATSGPSQNLLSKPLFAPLNVNKGTFGRQARLDRVQKAGKGNLLKASQKNVRVSALAKGVKFSIGSLIASLLVEPLLDGVEKGLLGAKERIGDFEGFTEKQGGARTASIVGGTRGAVSGALTGASIGALTAPLTGPFGAAIGAAAGAALGAAIGADQAEREQRRFDVLKNSELSGINLSQSLEALARSGFSNTEALNKTTKALLDFTSQISRNIQTFRSVGGDDFNTRLSERDIVPLRNNVPARVDQDISGRAFRFNRKAILKDVNAISTVLDTIPDKLFEDAEKSRQKIENDLFNSLGLGDLGVLSNLGDNADFDDLQNALQSVSDGSELFSKRLKNLQAAQALRIRQVQKEQKTQLLSVAGDNERKIALAGSAITASEVFASEFAKSGSIKSAAKASNKQFAEELTRNTKGGEKAFKDLFNRGGFQSDGGIAKFNKEVEKSLEFGQLTPKLRQLALNSGYSETELFSLIQTQDLFIDNTSRSSAAVLKAAAQQKELEEALRRTAKGIDAFVTALTRLENGVANAIGNFEITNQNVKNNVSGILSTQQNVSAVARGNVFNDPNASISDLRSGVQRVSGAIGGGQGFEDLAGVVSLRDQLPNLLKDIVDKATASGQPLTDVDFINQVKTGIKGFDQLPQSVQNSITGAAEATFQGTRQGDGGGALQGKDEIARLLEGGALKEFLAVSDKAAESLSKVTDTLNTFDALILESANLQIQSTRQLVDAQLKVLDKINSFEDRFDKFGNSSKDPLAIATLRVQQRTATLLNAGGAGGGALANVGGGDLLRRRKGLEDIIEDINVKIGQRTDVDPTDASSLAALDNDEINSLVKQLADTTSALEGTKKAIDVLANDTTELAAVEGKLASINEARLTGRQKLTALFGQLANAKNPFDRAKILSEFQRPVLAQIKANQGQALTPKEFFSLQQDLFQGPNGLIGLIQKNVFGRSNEEINAAIEQALAGNQQGGIDFLKSLGLNISQAVFGGAAATVKGTSPQEVALLERADQLLARSTALITGVAEANADAIAKQQEILRIELIKTKDALSLVVIEFEKLRKTLLSFAPGQQVVPPFIPKGGATDQFGNAQSVTGGPFDPSAQGFNRGGIARGIFKPKGTDKIPAMLTEGEFVMQKSAVDRIGVGNLKMLNNLSGPRMDRTLYLNDGGYTASDYAPIITDKNAFIAEFGQKAFNKRYFRGNKNINGLFENSKSEGSTDANRKLLSKVDATFARAAEKLEVSEGKVVDVALAAFDRLERESNNPKGGTGGQTSPFSDSPIKQSPFGGQIDDQSTPRSKGKSTNIGGAGPLGSPNITQEEADQQFANANKLDPPPEPPAQKQAGIDSIQDRGNFDIKRSQELLDEIKQYNTPEAKTARDKAAQDRAKNIPTNPMIAEGNRLLGIAAKNLQEAQAEAERLDKSFDKMLNDPFFDQIEELDKTGTIKETPPAAQAPPVAQAPPINKGQSPTLQELEKARKFEEEQIKEQAEISGQTVEELKSQIRLQELYNESVKKGLIDIKNVNGTFQYVVTELGKAKGVIKNDFGGFDNILGEQGPTGDIVRPRTDGILGDAPVEKGKSPSFDDIRNDYFREAEALGIDPLFLDDETNDAINKGFEDLRNKRKQQGKGKTPSTSGQINDFLNPDNKNVDLDDFLKNPNRPNPTGEKNFPFIGGKPPSVVEEESKEKTTRDSIREKKIEQKRQRDERKKRDRENPNNPEKLAADKRREEQRQRNQAIIDDPDSSKAAKKQARARQQELDARDNEGLSEQERRLNQKGKLEKRIKRFEEEAAASDDPSKFEGKLRTARENLRKINKSIAENERRKQEQESDLPPKPRPPENQPPAPPIPFLPDGDPFANPFETTDEFGNNQVKGDAAPLYGYPRDKSPEEIAAQPFTPPKITPPPAPSEDQPKIPVPPEATVLGKGSGNVFGGDCCDAIVKLLQKIADCVCSGKTATPPAKTLQKPSVPNTLSDGTPLPKGTERKPNGKIGLVPQPSSRNTIAPIDGLIAPKVPRGAIRKQDDPSRLPGSNLPKNSRSVTLSPTRNDGQDRAEYLRNKYIEQQNLRANREVSNRRGFVPQRGIQATRGIQKRNQRYNQDPDFQPLGTNRGNLPDFQYQGGRGNPKGKYLNNRQNDGAKIQGATELNQSLTQMATVSQQLNSAADKLASLPALEITINGKIAPVEVILNGTQMLAQFKEEFMNEVRLEIGNAIINQNTSLTNPVV